MQNELRDIGIVCGMCDTFSPVGTKVCPVCESELALFRFAASRPAVVAFADAVRREAELLLAR